MGFIASSWRLRWSAGGRGIATGRGPLFHEDGFCVLASAPLERGTFEGDSYALLKERGHPLVRLDSAAIAARFPSWRKGRYVDGYINPRAGWAESGAVVATLGKQAADAGVELRLGIRVRHLLASESRVTGVALDNGDRLTGDITVVAAGAWTPALVPELTELLPVTAQPVVHLRPSAREPFAPPAFITWCADIQKTGFYGFPANANGLVKIGNHGPGIAIQAGEYADWPDDADDIFRAFLRVSLPDLVDAPIVNRRLCRYSDCRDGDFVIAADPGRPGLVVAAGGSGHGFKFAPMLGPLIADAAEGRDNPWAHRFIWRKGTDDDYEAARFRGDTAG